MFRDQLACRPRSASLACSVHSLSRLAGRASLGVFRCFRLRVPIYVVLQPQPPRSAAGLAVVIAACVVTVGQGARQTWISSLGGTSRSAYGSYELDMRSMALLPPLGIVPEPPQHHSATGQLVLSLLLPALRLLARFLPCFPILMLFSLF